MPNTKLSGLQVPEQSIDLALAHVAALTGDPNAVVDIRLLHDSDAGAPAVPLRGALRDRWPEVLAWQAKGYGCFFTVNATDGAGRTAHHVVAARAAWVDLDGIDSRQQYEAAAAWSPAPSFAVQSSPDRWHIYWALPPGASPDRAEALNRRLQVRFNGDRAATDRARVLRLAGTLHLKRPGQPHLVRCEALGGYGQPVPVEALEASLAHVVVQDTGTGDRCELGDESLAAPSLDWLKRALDLVDPSDLDRGEWLSLSAAFKQAGWTLTDESTLRALWDAWCARYDPGTTGADGRLLVNDPTENHKLWQSIDKTELGWPSLVRRVPALKAALSFGLNGPLVSSPVLRPVTRAANDGAPVRVLDASPITEAEWNDTTALTPCCIVDDLYFADVGVRVAAGGVGKTTLALWEAAHIALSWPVFGNLVRRPGVTCILTSEDRRGMLVARLRKICDAMQLTADQVATVMQSVRITYVEQFRLTCIDRDTVVASDGVQQVIETFRLLAPSVIWIDPAVSFGVGESRVNDAEQGLILAGRMIRNAIPDCAVLFIHHTGKSNAREKTLDQYSGRGGSALADGARMVQVMQSLASDDWADATGVPLHDGQTGFVIARAKSSYTPPQPLIYVRRCGWSFEIVEGRSTGDSLGAAKETFMSLLGRLIEQGRYVNSTSGQLYAPLVFSRHEDAKGVAKKKFSNAMEALFKEGRIRNGVVGSGSKARTVILPVE